LRAACIITFRRAERSIRAGCAIEDQEFARRT
jgi:hypothetical protein